ncbi:MAG: BufA2 family periplasmic bufferin-type metallophore [Deltaproteobacteria bacterium]
MTVRTLKGAVLAGAVAGLFTGGNALAASKAKKADVNCAGINACKGQGSCAGADNSCKAQNSCKGKGWVTVSAKECKAKHGKVVAAKAM